MIKLTFPESKEQSAEYSRVVDFYEAIFRLDETALFRLVTDDCTYIVHGNVSWEGKPGLAKMLNTIKQNSLSHVRVDNMVADKNHAAINGIVFLARGARISFAEFLTFSPEQKIRHVDAYPILTSGQEH
jgi:hypothetical protein